ncbi:FkbM family methyltransferase [Trinickia sp. EG282A]|uniref:FkbM family methyltransferase n=1 Tax=Trinickia sp. EG282A TaxID=3237013 RepID=UPI0034D182F8
MAQSSQGLICRLRSKFFNANSEEATTMLIGLYGAGTLGRRIGQCLKLPFVFVDDTPEKQGALIDGHQVVTLKEFAERASREVARLHVTIYQPGFSFARKKSEIVASFHQLDCRPFTDLILNEAVEALPFLFLERRDVLERKRERYDRLSAQFADDLSRQTLEAHLDFRMSGDFEKLIVTPRHDVHFLIQRLPDDVTYVDAGAFDGDTAEEFAHMSNGRFKQIVLIEPDPANAARAKQRLEALGLSGRTIVHQSAISSTRGTMGFNALGSVGSSLDAHAATKVQTVLLSDLDIPGPAYFKLDIEGAEIPALDACSEYLGHKRVFLGISVYHRPDDLLEAASIISSLDAGYDLFLRCHGSGGEDLMLYAVPRGN